MIGCCPRVFNYLGLVRLVKFFWRFGPQVKASTNRSVSTVFATVPPEQRQ